MRRIALRLPGIEVRARLHEAAAPRMTSRVWDLLPLRVRLRSSRWSGESTFASVAGLVDRELQPTRTSLPRENPATFMSPGKLYVGAATGGFGLPYGEAQSRDFGSNTWMISVATIESDLDDFIAELATVRRVGELELDVTRIDAT